MSDKPEISPRKARAMYYARERWKLLAKIGGCGMAAAILRNAIEDLPARQAIILHAIDIVKVVRGGYEVRLAKLNAKQKTEMANEDARNS